MATVLRQKGSPLATNGTKDDSHRWRYGITVVIAGLITILGAFLVAVWQFDTAAEVSTALAPITGVVGALVGAYFGVQVGSEGKKDAEKDRKESQELANAALGALPPEQAAEVQRSFR